jgi:hypothetical protein
MNKARFERLFHQNLHAALDIAEEKTGKTLPKDLTIELHGAGHSGEEMKTSEALEALYIGKDCFYRVIDISVVAASRTHTRIFVRVSSHSPGKFDETWNIPPGSGPFKLLEPSHIEVED